MASQTARRRLGIELRALRESAGLNIDQAAGVAGISASHLSRIERGQVGIRVLTLRALAQTYGADGDTVGELVQTAADTAKRSDKTWWQSLGSAISPKYATLIGFEAEATSIRAFGPVVVPGLLQTEGYARAVLENGPSRLGPAEIETRTGARKSRQAIFDADRPPRGWFILDEAALRRRVGGAEVMRAQLDHLAHVAERPDIDLQVIPLSTGAHAGTLGPLVILGFAEGDDVVYCETYAGDLYPEAVSWYGDVFNRLARDALSKTESADLIKTVAEETR